MTEYEDFVDQFKPNLTTDDCYTQAEVYEWILSYVKDKYAIPDSVRIIRPFKPEGDYKAEDYSGDCIVIDNPPFSILAEIRRYYINNNIKYFLFAPHLTLFGASIGDDCKIVAGADIVYHNGANVKTSFVTNLCDYEIDVDPTFRREIQKIQQAGKTILPKYSYPDGVITVSRLSKIVERGGELKLKGCGLFKISKLEAQKEFKKTIFGCGYLCSASASAEIKAAEIKAAEIKAADTVTFWRLSDKEKNIIKELSYKS